jgi:hypothetical protein
MQFVGPPFTFSIRQVGSNCGLLVNMQLNMLMVEYGGWVKQEDFLFTMVPLNQFLV